MTRNLHMTILSTVSGVLIALTVFLGYGVLRADFARLLGAYGAFFGLYGWILWQRQLPERVQQGYLVLGIFLRALLLFSTPQLSDDVYRFLWDGRLAAHGIHPFAELPSYYMAHPAAIPGITRALFEQLNSPGYYTVYPPICQAVFWVAGKLFPESAAGGIFIIKLFLLGCEAASVWMLRRIGLRAALYYALNPLAIIEVVGNAHFEGAMWCFLLAGWRALARRQSEQAGLWWALATASKLLPVLFIPLVWRWLGWRKGLSFGLVFAVASVVLFLPLLNPAVLAHMAGSLKLYFRQFEFNASMYYVLKYIGLQVAPPTVDVARTLGPWMGAATATGVSLIAAFGVRRGQSPQHLASAMMWAVSLYLLNATTVHPWYVLLPFGICLLTPHWRFPVLWSGAVILSYSHYAGGGFQENYAWIGLEYGIVLLGFGLNGLPPSDAQRLHGELPPV